MNLFCRIQEERHNCPSPSRGYQIPSALLAFLREYFQPDYQKWSTDLADLTYYGPDGSDRKDEHPSAIEIFRLGEERSEVTDLPKILLRRESIADVSRGLRDAQRSSPAVEEVYEVVAAGSVVIFGMSRVFGESELLAWEVFELMRHFRSFIRRELQLSRFKVSQIGAVGKLREFPGFYATPVVIDCAYQDNVRITNESFPYRELDLRIQVEQ